MAACKRDNAAASAVLFPHGPACSRMVQPVPAWSSRSPPDPSGICFPTVPSYTAGTTQQFGRWPGLVSLLSNVLYFLCLLSSLTCTLLLLRGYRRTGMRLLLWSGICFICLSLANLVLFVDVQLPDVNLHDYRLGLNLAAGIVLMFGFIWEAK